MGNLGSNVWSRTISCLSLVSQCDENLGSCSYTIRNVWSWIVWCLSLVSQCDENLCSCSQIFSFKDKCCLQNIGKSDCFLQIAWNSTSLNMHVLIGSNLYPHTSVTCQYIQSIDPLWLQPLMLQNFMKDKELLSEVTCLPPTRLPASSWRKKTPHFYFISVVKLWISASWELCKL